MYFFRPRLFATSFVSVKMLCLLRFYFESQPLEAPLTINIKIEVWRYSLITLRLFLLEMENMNVKKKICEGRFHEKNQKVASK